MQIVSLNIGRPQIVVRGDRQYSTAIDRRPVAGPLALSVEGFDGDRVSDLSVHGGPDKAVCCFASEHYADFSARLGRPLEIPSFGENLTLAGLLETAACVGDTFAIGTAAVQITQPRQPCFKLAGKLAEPRVIEWTYATGQCGFYFRVLQPGHVAPGAALALMARPHPELTIARLLRVRADASAEPELASRLAELPELSASWRDHFRKRGARRAEADD